MFDDPRKPLGVTGPDRDNDKRFGTVDTPDWGKVPPEQLIMWFEEIRDHLPPTQLSKMNMEQETLLQYHATRYLQTVVLNDDSVPANQKAQVANSVSSVLEKITRMQMEIYSTERFKAIELLLIRTLNKLPEDVAGQFIDEYEKILAEHAKTLS